VADDGAIPLTEDRLDLGQNKIWTDRATHQGCSIAWEFFTDDLLGQKSNWRPPTIRAMIAASAYLLYRFWGAPAAPGMADEAARIWKARVTPINGKDQGRQNVNGASPVDDGHKVQAQTDVDTELPPRWVRVTIMLSLLALLAIAPILVAVTLLSSGALSRIAEEHARAVVGVPWAGGAALIVVLVLRSSFGRIEFRLLGIEFKGASGPIVMWFLCFLGEIFSIQLLW